MSNTTEHLDHSQRFEGGQEADGIARSWSTILLLLAVAAIFGGASWFLPAREPIARFASLDNWLIFAARILRDTLQALSLVALAVVASIFVPRIGLLIERIVLRSSLRRFLAVTSVLAILSSGLFSYFVLDHMPHIQDEIAMLFQAEILAGGKLYAQAPEPTEPFDCEFVIVDGPKWYSKYFFGQALLLVPGIWLGVPWLVHPVLAGVAVCLTYYIGHSLLNAKVARLAAVLMVISPFRISAFGMMLSHPGSLVMLAIFALAMIKVVQNPQRVGWSFLAGSALGLAGNSRPLSALAMGTVIGVAALLAMPWRQFRWSTGAAFVLGLAIFAALFFGYNKALTGDPLLTPFNKWSKTDRLGFGSDVGLEYWRNADKGHSLRKGLLKDTYFNFDALGENLTGWGRVTLLLLIWPLIRSPWPKRSWILAAVIGSLIFVHLFHVSHGVLAGQARYWSESMPMMMLLAAIALVSVRRFLPRLCRYLGILPAVRTGRSACWLAGVMLTLGGVINTHIPLIRGCCESFWMQGPTLRDLAGAAQLDNALVLVKTGSYRNHFSSGYLDLYPCGFMLNDPDLNAPVIYARDLGDQLNAALISRYPGRKVYRVNMKLGQEARLIPISTPTTGKGP